MKAYKTREEPKQLQILELLDVRMELPEDKKRYYLSLKKGYEGESMFDQQIEEKLHNNCYVLNDLLLQFNNTTFQIDTVLIFGNMLRPFEVKNYEGDYYYENDKIYSSSGREIGNPLNQLAKTESLFRNLIHSHGFSLPISANVVFINPEFSLYQAPLNKPFIFHSQLNRFFNQLNEQPSKLTDMHKQLANKLASLHLNESPFQQLPTYRYDMLKKGIICATCRSFALVFVGRNCVCKECGHVENARAAILRSIWEYKLLFPDRKVTTVNIHDWCQIIDSKKRIKRVLDEHFEIVGVRQWAYYV